MPRDRLAELKAEVSGVPRTCSFGSRLLLPVMMRMEETWSWTLRLKQMDRGISWEISSRRYERHSLCVFFLSSLGRLKLCETQSPKWKPKSHSKFYFSVTARLMLGRVEHKHSDFLVAVSKTQQKGMALSMLRIAYCAEISEQLTALTDEVSTISNRIRRDLKCMCCDGCCTAYPRSTGRGEQERREACEDHGGLVCRPAHPQESGARRCWCGLTRQHATMARKFVAVMTRFSEIQAANKMKQRDMVKRQCKIGLGDKCGCVVLTRQWTPAYPRTPLTTWLSTAWRTSFPESGY